MTTLIKKAITGIDRYATRHMTHQMLDALDDRTLKDIGLNRERVRRRQYHLV